MFKTVAKGLGGVVFGGGDAGEARMPVASAKQSAAVGA